MKKLFSFLAMFLVFMFFVAPMPIFADGDGWVEDAGGNMIVANDIPLINIAVTCLANADSLFKTNLANGIPALDSTDKDVWLAVFWHRSAEAII